MKNLLKPLQIYILIGLPGSGKSTWSKNTLTQSDNDTVIVSSDCIREMLHGKYLYDKKFEPLVVQSTFDTIKLAINSKYNVIIDEALLSLDVTRRMMLVNLIKSYDDTVKIRFVSFKPDMVTSVERRMKEHRGISKERWQKIYEDLFTSYESVQESEPFDSIEHIDIFKQAT